jgi:hypothetical protein
MGKWCAPTLRQLRVARPQGQLQLQGMLQQLLLLLQGLQQWSP